MRYTEYVNLQCKCFGSSVVLDVYEKYNRVKVYMGFFPFYLSEKKITIKEYYYFHVVINVI